MIEASESREVLANQLSRVQQGGREIRKNVQLQLVHTYEALVKEIGGRRADLVVYLEQISSEAGYYSNFPAVEYVISSIQQQRKLFIGRVCPAHRALGYAVFLLSTLEAAGDNRGITLVSSQDLVQRVSKSIPGITLLSYQQYSKADPKTVVVVHTNNHTFLDVACAVMDGPSPHIIIGSEEIYNTLRSVHPTTLKTYRLCKCNSNSAVVDCYDRTNHLDDRLKIYMEDGLSDILVLCESDKMKEITLMAHQHRRRSINCLEVQHRMEQFNYVPKKTNVFIAESASQFRKAAGSFEQLDIKTVLDYNNQRTTNFDLEREVYVQENFLPATSEEFSERLNLAEELAVDRYVLHNKDGVRCLRKCLTADNIAVAVLKYGKSKVEQVLKNIHLEESQQQLSLAINFLGKHRNLLNEDLQLGIKREDWAAIPSELFANEILLLSSDSKIQESPATLHYHYLLFAYLRNTVNKSTEKKSRLNDMKGDLNMLQQLIVQYHSFDSFVKQELNRSKRKTSEGSVELERMGSVLRQQSSFQGEGKPQTFGRTIKFNPNFIMKWADEFDKLRGDGSVNLDEKQNMTKLCSGRHTSFSKPLKKYVIDNITKDGYYVGKYALLANIFPQLKNLQVFKLLKSNTADRSDEILVGEQCHAEMLGQEDQVIEFNQITTSILSQATIRSFEENHNCEVELNPEFQSLIISCKKELKEEVEKAFRQLLQQLLSTVKNQLIPRSYGVKTLQFGAGARISSINNPTEHASNSLVAIRNLPGQWTEADVIELLEDQGNIQSVVMHRNRSDDQIKDAIIEFSRAEDALQVYKLYDGVEICGNVLRICKPSDIRNPFMKEHKLAVLKWYTHKCDKTGQVLFQTEEGCRRAMDQLKQYLNEQLTVPAEGLLVLKNLQEWVDEEYLRQLYGQLGGIHKINLKKIALPQKDNSQLLYYHLNEALGAGSRFTVSEIRTVDREVGEKQVSISFDNLENVEKVYNYFNNKRQLLGKARTYARRDIQCTYLGNESLMKLLKKLIEEFLKQKDIKQQELQLSLANFEDEYYLTVQSTNGALFRLVVSKIDELRRGQILKPDAQGLSFTELGKKRLSEIKQKFICEITAVASNKTLSVICNSTDLDAIRKEVECLPKHRTSLEYRLTRKMFQAMVSNQQYLKQLEQLVKSELNLENLSLELTGEIGELVRAKQFITDLGKDINKQLVSQETGVCDICMEAFESVPIKLMGCGHVFCKNCLSGVLDNCLSNYSDFPVRCPTCSDFMAFRDIEFLADGPERYNKLRKIAINDFIGNNSDKICYCLTVGCDGIGFITTAKTVCDMCNKEYCLACKKPFHHGMTCWEASVGSEALFKMYISSNDVRKCPNKKCPALIQKNGGCNKVFCAMCKMSICWKCMKHFPEQQLAYNHLNAQHGGYFDN